jgi:hypothetical protein
MEREEEQVADDRRGRRSGVRRPVAGNLTPPPP